MTLLQPFLGVARFGQGVGRRDEGPDLALVDQRPISASCVPSGRALKSTPRAPCCAGFSGEGSPSAETRMPPGLRHRPGPLPGFSVDEVEHHINIANHFLEPLGLVVDRPVGAELVDKVDILPRHRGEYRGALYFGELDGEMADAAGTAVDQYGLADLGLSMVEKPLPSRQCRERHRRRFDIGEARRLGRCFIRLSCNVPT
jgi:hypothetical protein